MDDDTSRLDAALAGAESRIFTLERELKSLQDLFEGKTRQNVPLPSGVTGFNQIYEVIAAPLAIIEADEGGSGGTFLGSYDDETGVLTIGPGSYQFPLGTNTDVDETTGTGKFAYAIIKHSSAGVFDSFKIEVSSSTKDPVNKDATDTFAEFSNVLLAEVVGTGDDAKLVQRRVGNLAFYHRVVDGDICLWPETTGGSSLT